MSWTLAARAAPGGADGSPTASTAPGGGGSPPFARSPTTAPGGGLFAASALQLLHRTNINNPYYFNARAQRSHRHHALDVGSPTTTTTAAAAGASPTAAAARASQPLRRPRLRPSAGPDENKRLSEEERQVSSSSLAQPQVPGQPSPADSSSSGGGGGLAAAETSPTMLRRAAQYGGGAGPRRSRPVPDSLRTGSDAVAVAAVVDAFYTTPFLQLACRAAAEREVAARLRGGVQKMSSRLHMVRVEGLREATALLLEWTTQAAVESAERQRVPAAPPRRGSAAAGGGADGEAGLVLPPYDAVRVEVLGGSSLAVTAHDVHSHHPHHHHQPQHSHSHSPRHGSAAGLAPAAAAASPVADARRRHRRAAAAARRANALRSPSWDVVQHALEGVDYTSAIFNRILVPRLEVRNAMSTGMPISIQLTSDAALQWTTLPAPMRTPVAAAVGGGGGGGDAAGGGAAPTPLAPPRENQLARATTAVTYEEQELALRYIQGTCILLYHQRRSCSEGCLLYYATEVFQCLRSHADALFTLQRRELESLEGEGQHTHQPQQQQQQPQQQSMRRIRARRFGAGAGGSAVSSGSGRGPRLHPSDLHPRQASWSASAALVAAGVRESASRAPVAVDPALVRVVVALVDAVEAACHYNPSSLRRLVQTGGVTAMLNLAYCPFMPTPVRAAVLNTISVLLQQVTPLRRYVAAASRAPEGPAAAGRGGGGAGGHVEPSPDPLLQRMLENAVHDNPLGRDGQHLPFSTDFGSASKFDSAVRDWFFANGLGNVLPSVAQLQDLRHTFQPHSFVVPPGSAGATGTAGPAAAAAAAAAAAVVAGGSAAGVGAGAGAGAGGGGSAGAGVGGGSGMAMAGVNAAAAGAAGMQREGELHRKRISRLLECMDGRELR